MKKLLIVSALLLNLISQAKADEFDIIYRSLDYDPYRITTRNRQWGTIDRQPAQENALQHDYGTPNPYRDDYGRRQQRCYNVRDAYGNIKVICQ